MSWYGDNKYYENYVQTGGLLYPYNTINGVRIYKDNIKPPYEIQQELLVRQTRVSQPMIMTAVISTPTISTPSTTLDGVSDRVSTPARTNTSNLKFYVIAALAAVLLGVGYGHKGKKR